MKLILVVVELNSDSIKSNKKLKLKKKNHNPMNAFAKHVFYCESTQTM